MHCLCGFRRQHHLPSKLQAVRLQHCPLPAGVLLTRVADIIALNAACQQQPAVGKTLALNGTVFSAALIGSVSPSSGGALKLSTAMIAAAAVVVVLIVLAVSSALAFWWYKRRQLRTPKPRGAKTRSPSAWRWGDQRPKSGLSFCCRSDPSTMRPGGRRSSSSTGGGPTSTRSRDLLAPQPQGNSALGQGDHGFVLAPPDPAAVAVASSFRDWTARRQQQTVSMRSSVYSTDSDVPVFDDADGVPMPTPSLAWHFAAVARAAGWDEVDAEGDWGRV